MCPVALSIDPAAGEGDALKRAKEAAPVDASQSPHAISLNYLGQIDQVLQADSGWSLLDAGLSTSPRRPRPHALEIAASVRRGCLEWEIVFTAGVAARASAERLSAALADRLVAIGAHCRTSDAGAYTPSDFPDAALSQADIDAIVASAPALFHRNLESIDPPSAAQEGILFHSLLAGGVGVYVTQVSFVLDGALDAAAFDSAWQAVTARHDALRICFARDGRQNPLQLTLARVALPVVSLDLRGAADPEAGLAAVLEDDRRRGFDVAAAPLARVTLVRLRDDSHVCVWTTHHAILDGWSLAVILRDLVASYEQPGISMPRLRPFRDQLRALRRLPVAEAEQFWRDEVGQWSESIELPFARHSTERNAPRMEIRRDLPAAVVAAVSSAARTHRLTRHALLQGAWAVVLSRYTDRDEVLFGATVSGRASTQLPAIESMAGLFIQTVPVRIRVDEGESAADWLHGLQMRQIEREVHAHLPLVRIEGLSALPRGTPLFETLLVFENYPVDEGLRRGIGGLSARDVRSVEHPHYPLTIVVSGDERLSLAAVYDAGRFDDAAIEELLERYTRVLASMAEAVETGRGLGTLSLMSPDEEREVVATWNATTREYPRDKTIVDLFEDQVARTPDATAVVFEDETLTYAELDRWSNRLAHDLQARGVGPDVLVAVCLERSLEMVVALSAC